MNEPWKTRYDEPRGEAVREQPLSHEWLPHALLVGFLASLIMLFGFVIAYGLAALLAVVLPVDQPGVALLRDWLYALTHNPVIDLGRDNFYLALAAYLVGGLFWAVLYAGVVAPRLPGPHWQRGLWFSLLPAVVSLVVVLPLLGGGLLGFDLGAGPLPLLGNLLLHAIYGIALGVLYGPAGYLSAEDWRPTTAEERRVLVSAERVAAIGALVGGLLGVATGLLLLAVGLGAIVLPQAPVAGILLVTIGSGIALGALAGSLAGLRPKTERPG